jgi:hypothetical protein
MDFANEYDEHNEFDDNDDRRTKGSACGMASAKRATLTARLAT